MKELISRISEEVISHFEKQSFMPNLDDDVKGKRYELTEERFRELRLNYSEMTKHFIDGGMTEVFSSSSIALHFLRISSVTYKGMKLKDPVIKEMFCLSKMVEEDDKLYYLCKLFSTKDPSQNKTYKLRVSDPSIKDGVNNGTISRFISMVMRFSELEQAKVISQSSPKNSVLIIDGALQATYSGENKLLSELIAICKDNDVLLLGLPKTDTQVSENGQEISAALRNIEKKAGWSKKMWFYGPVISYEDDSFPANIFYAKLHKSAKSIFRIEVCNSFEMVDMGKVLGEIATISADPVFLGYPYGLIKVDSLARVSNNERLQLRSRFLNKISVEDIEASSSAHSVLDNIRF